MNTPIRVMLALVAIGTISMFIVGCPAKETRIRRETEQSEREVETQVIDPEMQEETE